jgi:hypothetical protein
MTEAEASERATQLHRAIGPVLSVKDMKVVEKFLRKAFDDGVAAATCPKPGTIIEMTEPGKGRAWVCR